MNKLSWYKNIQEIEQDLVIKTAEKWAEGNENLKELLLLSRKMGLETFSLSTKSKNTVPQIAFKLNPKSREILLKLIALQIQKNDRSFFLSTKGNNTKGNIFISFSSNIYGQDEGFFQELLNDISNIDKINLEENLEKNSDALLKFAENIDFWREGDIDSQIPGISFEVNSNSGEVIFYYGLFHNEKFKFNNIAKEYEEKSLKYGVPKDTTKMTDEEYERAVEVWCEGNQELKKFLLNARKVGLKTKGCCGGHDDKPENPQISLIIDEESSQLVKKLVALELQRKNGFAVLIYNQKTDTIFFSLNGHEKGFNEEYFRKLNTELEEILENKVNPKTENLDRLDEYLSKRYQNDQIRMDSVNNRFIYYRI